MGEHVIPLDILDDLSSRFIINVPEEERKDLVRICFQIELAHWFYLDFHCAEDYRKLKTCNMKEFSTHIFKHIPFLRQHLPRIDTVLEQWREYKMSVPTFGAIVLNEDLTKVLLVQNYWAKNSWGFPKGKVNEDEDPSHCAVREVYEETGFDISKFIDENDYIESLIHDRLVRLYIISGVKIDTKFEPQTRKEIKNVEWFLLNDLPTTSKDMTPKVKMGVNPNAFFMVVPFIKRMKRWVLEKNQRDKQRLAVANRRHRHKSLGDTDKNIDTRRSISSVQTITNNSYNKINKNANTSPIRNRQRTTTSERKLNGKCEIKNTTKGAIKRNLFGENSQENNNNNNNNSPMKLAQQLIDSPKPVSSNITKNIHQHHQQQQQQQQQQTSSFCEDNSINSQSFENTINKINSEINNILFKSKSWMHFSFDKQAILKCF